MAALSLGRLGRVTYTAALLLLAVTATANPQSQQGRLSLASGLSSKTAANEGRFDSGGPRTCLVATDGVVRCWGQNFFGSGGGGHSFVPAVVDEFHGAEAIALGQSHGCMLRPDASVACFGEDDLGQLGDGDPSPGSAIEPVEVAGVVATRVVAGSNHSCAITPARTVVCWGDNDRGQLGGTTSAGAPVANVQGLADVVALSAGDDHTCAVIDGGGVRCWGYNYRGQLGDGTTTGNMAPVTVVGIDDAVDVAAGRDHSCALLADGTARCWGANGRGQLGDGSNTSSSTQRVVAGLGGIAALAAGYERTCALGNDGSVRCWGNNDFGNLGDGTQQDRNLPVQAAGVVDAVAIVLGGATCAWIRDGTVRCWGSNASGYLGVGSHGTDSAIPLRVTLPAAAELVAAGGGHSCAVLTGDGISCWGDNASGQLGENGPLSRWQPAEVSGISDVQALALGGLHTCALLQDGGVSCWGENGDGQLGNGATTDSPAPVAVDGIDDAEALTSGERHTCVVQAGGRVQCWGDNLFGMLGDGSISDRSLPVDVQGLPAALAVAAGWRHTCALVTDGSVWCWGSDQSGQLGDGMQPPRTYSAVPLQVSGLQGAVAIAAHGEQTCALDAEGSVWCWGAHIEGVRWAPGLIEQLPAVVDLDAGEAFACALLSDATLDCWGSNFRGGLGNGNIEDSANPVRVLRARQVQQLAAGTHHVCLVDSEGSVDCWGYNQYGQLGIEPASLSLSTLPVRVYGLPCADCGNLRVQITPATEPMSTGGVVEASSAAFDIAVENLGPDDLYGLSLRVLRAEGLSNTSWTCSRPGGDCLPASGSGLPHTAFDLAAGELVTVRLEGDVAPDADFFVIETRAELPDGIDNLDPQDDALHYILPASADGVFRSGFE